MPDARDLVGTLAPSTGRMLIKPGSRIVDIAGKFVKSVLPDLFNVLVAKHNVTDLDALARVRAQGTLHLPIARTVPYQMPWPH